LIGKTARAASSTARVIQLVATLEAEIDARRACIAVVGLGAVGLPLARAFVDAGFRVIGFDRDPDKIARVGRGETPLRHLDPELVPRLLASQRFEPTCDKSRLSGARVALVCVPTPLSPRREPDLDCVLRAARALAENLPRGALIVLESTSYPGTTRGVLGAAFRAHGWRPGEDCWLAYSPEREDPGRRDIPSRDIAKLVGGTCARSADLALRLYRTAFTSVERTSRAEVAEAAKLLENTFRAVNIALVNELKVVLESLSIDVWEVIEAAATKPFGFMKFTPGPGLGGQCIPIDPHYLDFVARGSGCASRFIELAAEINRAMPRRVVERTREALRARREGSIELARARVLVLGVAYKPEVDIVAESPALELVELFDREGADVRYSDPFVPEILRSPSVAQSRAAIDGRSPALGGSSPALGGSSPAPGGSSPALERSSPGLEGSLPALGGISPGLDPRSLALDAQVVASFDAVVIATDHRGFDYDLVAAHARLVIDTRNALASRMAGRASYVKA
jgi:UDP-N-acetyl-D-glucosamine dehydrogenase